MCLKHINRLRAQETALEQLTRFRARILSHLVTRKYKGDLIHALLEEKQTNLILSFVPLENRNDEEKYTNYWQSIRNRTEITCHKAVIDPKTTQLKGRTSSHYSQDSIYHGCKKNLYNTYNN